MNNLIVNSAIILKSLKTSLFPYFTEYNRVSQTLLGLPVLEQLPRHIIFWAPHYPFLSRLPNKEDGSSRKVACRDPFKGCSKRNPNNRWRTPALYYYKNTRFDGYVSIYVFTPPLSSRLGVRPVKVSIGSQLLWECTSAKTLSKARPIFSIHLNVIQYNKICSWWKQFCP